MEDWGQFVVWHLLESTVFALALVLAAGVLRLGSSNVLCWIYRIGLLKFAIPSVWLFGVVQERFLSSAANESIVFGPLQGAAGRCVSGSHGNCSSRRAFGASVVGKLGSPCSASSVSCVGPGLARGMPSRERVSFSLENAAGSSSVRIARGSGLARVLARYR
jgi:hypothetical protein